MFFCNVQSLMWKRRKQHSPACCLLEEMRHSNIVVRFLHIHACCVVLETKITAKACHTTNMHDLNGNLTIQTVKRTQHSYVRHWVLDFKIVCKKVIDAYPFLRPLKRECPKFSSAWRYRGSEDKNLDFKMTPAKTSRFTKCEIL